MADKSFGVKELNLLNASGTPTVTSPNNLNLNANTVAISTSCTIGNNLTVTSTTNSANLNVTGIGTLTRGFATDLSVSGISTISQPSNANPHSLWDVVNNGASAYRFTGPGQDGAEDNPNIYLVRGQRYIFKVNASGHPFQLRVANGGAAYSDGVTNNGAQSGNVVINVQHDAPAQLYYQCTSHGGMVGNIYIVGGPQVISGVVTATTFVGNLTGNVTGTASANAVLTGSTNNQLVTVTGANAITGESNLTYDGTNLQLITDANSEGIKSISNGNSYPIFELDSDRASAGNTLGKLVSKWNNTEVASISFVSGDDTSNKDNASIYLNTRSGGSGNVLRLRITPDGQLGTTAIVRSAYGGLDLCSQGATNYGTLTLGAGGGQNGQSRSSNQENQFRIMMPTYADPSLMTTVLYGTSGTAGHDLFYGGGTGWAYATNTHRFFTTANQTTGTGSERLRILANGHVAIGADIANDTGMFKVIAADGQSDDQYVGAFKNLEATTNRNWGILIQAGSSSTDESLRVRNGANNRDHFKITGDGAVTMPSQPAFSAYMANTYSWNNQTIVYDSELFDYGSNYSTSTGEFTAPVTGLYVFGVKFRAGTGFGQFGGMFERNGSTYKRAFGQNSYSSGDCITAMDIIPMTAGQTMRLRFEGSHGGATGGSQESGFWGYLLH